MEKSYRNIQELSWDIEDIVGVQRIDAKKDGYDRLNSEYLVRNQVQASGRQPARFSCTGWEVWIVQDMQCALYKYAVCIAEAEKVKTLRRAGLDGNQFSGQT